MEMTASFVPFLRARGSCHRRVVDGALPIRPAMGVRVHTEPVVQKQQRRDGQAGTFAHARPSARALACFAEGEAMPWPLAGVRGGRDCALWPRPACFAILHALTVPTVRPLTNSALHGQTLLSLLLC
jgi:hypothetical protein